MGVLRSEWLGYTVNLHWELDSGTRADVERLDLALPAHLHVESDPPRRPNPGTWTVTFDDPPF
ncbi:hypothetical protein AB0L82_43575 [Nocardia sp. NPDC052001]|uniref:hypothetical protein n=1 Tax=Nocardia sp. NPDC052001 TaxID=3154853 RepID=UPI0034178D9F